MSPITTQALLDRLDPQMLIWLGLSGLLVSTLFFTIFVYRRLRWHLRRLTKTTKKPPGLLTGFRNATALLVFIAVSGMLLFLGFFFQTYHRFNFEKPVAEINTQPVKDLAGTSLPTTQVHYRSMQNNRDRYFFVKGDQWMIEGDILKWRPWLTLLGLDTRYRLTRITGRYLDLDKERTAPRTVHSLATGETKNAKHLRVWRWLYRSGHKLPLVDAVYGNAAYQDTAEPNHFQVFVGPSGFIVRKIEKGEDLGIRNKS